MKSLLLLPLLVLATGTSSNLSDKTNQKGKNNEKTFSAGIAPNVSLVSIEPVNASGQVVYLSCASPTSKENETAQLSVLVKIKNNEAADLRLDKVIIECSGGSQNVSRTFESKDRGGTLFKSQKSDTWQNDRKYHEMGDVIMLIPPYPTGIKIKFYFKNFTDPFIVSKTLTSYQNANPGERL